MHILLRPVPGLSATLERCQATFLFAAAKCTNIDSAISTPAPPAITGSKMAPRDTRQNTVPATWGPAGQARREDPRPGSAAVARSSAGRRAPAAQQGSLRAPQYAGGGTGSWRPRVDCGGTRRNRPGSLTPQRFLLRQSLRRVLAAIVSAAVRGPVASARDDPRRPAAVSARPQHRQLPSRTPGMTCRHSRPESRKGAERRAGIRNLHPFRIPVPPCAPSPAIRLPAGRAGRGTLRPAIPLGSGIGCHVDSHSRLRHTSGRRFCGHSRRSGHVTTMTACPAECGYARGHCTRLDAALPRRSHSTLLSWAGSCFAMRWLPTRTLGYTEHSTRCAAARGRLCPGRYACLTPSPVRAHAVITGRRGQDVTDSA